MGTMVTYAVRHRRAFSIGSVALGALSYAQAAGAAAQDYSALTTDVAANIAAAVTVALPIAGSVLAILIGIRLIRRIAK